MSHGQGTRPLTKDGKRVDVDEDDARSELATTDKSATELLGELLLEAKKIRRSLEVLIGEEIDDVDI